MVRLPVLLLVSVALALCACGAPKPEVEQDISAEDEAPVEAEEPAVADSVETPVVPEIVVPERDPYRLAVGDFLGVKFFYYPAYNISLVVRPDGYVTVPLVGEVHAEGMKPSELEDVISMSDRVMVLHLGKITGVFSREAADMESVLLCAMGKAMGADVNGCVGLETDNGETSAVLT